MHHRGFVRQAVFGAIDNGSQLISWYYKNITVKMPILLCLKCHHFKHNSKSLLIKIKLFLVFLYTQVHHTMELTLKSNNQESLATIIALAKKLNIMIEQNGANIGNSEKDAMKKPVLDEKAKEG